MVRRDKPRLGPWLRRYSQPEEKSTRDRVVEIALSAGAAIGFLVVLGGVLTAFLKFPLWTFAGLVAVWGVGLAVLMVRR